MLTYSLKHLFMFLILLVILISITETLLFLVEVLHNRQVLDQSVRVSTPQTQVSPIHQVIQL
jgi:hypothetical protein